jgi:hypothetical protein
VKLRELLRKINDSVRPVRVQGEGSSGSDPLLDGRVAGRAGNFHSAPTLGNTTDWAPSQQDEEAHH